MSLEASESENDVENVIDDCSGFTCLTELVRERYVKYLERQLRENLHAWQNNCSVERVDKAEAKIKQCVARLEDRALKACMMTQVYQRTMVKTIATIRRDTQENRLEKTLYGLIKAKSSEKASGRYLNDCFVDKATQTGTNQVDGNQTNNFGSNCEGNDDDYSEILTLQQKIDLFQEKFVEAFTAPSKSKLNVDTTEKKIWKTKEELKPNVANQLLKTSKLSEFSPPVESPMSISSPVGTQDANQLAIIAQTTAAPATGLEDEVARELALLFGDEKTDLDDIFGIDPNAATDDPQMNSILKEIENATQSQVSNKTAPVVKVETQLQPDIIKLITNSNKEEDLSKSLWPCELYMQRHVLNASLGRLIDEDYRWLDIMKDTFCQLFGEDSDDEFTIFSPSIDLDEVLMGSCIRRISPWVVQHLMKPLNDGLIGNRFLFKKLAKKLAKSIIMDNQYPDERFVKQAVEHFFCLKNDVNSMQDLDDMSIISFKQLE